jgi:2-polyprenyl-6-methoxyphenol hydroxylase-like FAD-dependent oxidoreductase
MSSTFTTFRVSLNTNIIGSGISGLSAATALARRRHSVRVLELSETLSEFGAGIQITPNATRILCALGLRESCPCPGCFDGKAVQYGGAVGRLRT